MKNQKKNKLKNFNVVPINDNIIVKKSSFVSIGAEEQRLIKKKSKLVSSRYLATNNENEYHVGIIVAAGPTAKIGGRPVLSNMIIIYRRYEGASLSLCGEEHEIITPDSCIACLEEMFDGR